MAISLKRLMELDNVPPKVTTPVASSPIVAQQNVPAGQEVNVGLDFTNFERTIAAFTENSKNQFQTKLLNLIGGKRVFLRGSKGYGQPIKDYTINVKNVSIDFYYERYVVVLKDEDDKEYFLEPGYKIKILGQAQIVPKSQKRKKKQVPVTPQGQVKTQPQVQPQVQPQG
jgi:hypothetical protein